MPRGRKQAQNERGDSPLPWASLHVLIALGSDTMHGYALMQAVEELTEGVVKMGPGTLYGTIKRLLAYGLIEERDGPANDDERRRYYRVTAEGSRVRAGELHRLRSLVVHAQTRRLLPGMPGLAGSA